MKIRFVFLCLAIASVFIVTCGPSQAETQQAYFEIPPDLPTDTPLPVVIPGAEAVQDNTCKDFFAGGNGNIAGLLKMTAPTASYLDQNGNITWNGTFTGVWAYIQKPDGNDEGYAVAFNRDPGDGPSGWHRDKIGVTGVCVAVVDVIDSTKPLSSVPRFYFIKP